MILDDRFHFLEVTPVLKSLSVPPNLLRYVAVGTWHSVGCSHLALV